MYVYIYTRIHITQLAWMWILSVCSLRLHYSYSIAQQKACLVVLLDSSADGGIRLLFFPTNSVSLSPLLAVYQQVNISHLPPLPSSNHTTYLTLIPTQLNVRLATLPSVTVCFNMFLRFLSFFFFFLIFTPTLSTFLTLYSRYQLIVEWKPTIYQLFISN